MRIGAINVATLKGKEELVEVKNAVKKMKKGKFPGGDGLPVEIIRAGGECVLNKLLNIFNTAYITEMFHLTGKKEL